MNGARVLVAIGIAATLALAGCARAATGTWSAAPARASAAPGGSIQWEDCSKEAERIVGTPLSTPAECGVVQVPQDWSDASGATFDIALMRLPHTGRQRVGSLLVNPGGPGASGVDLAAYSTLLLPTSVRQRFDVIGFDPRGVGRSTQIACIPDAAKDAMTAATADPVSQSEFDAQVGRAKELGAECARKYGDKLGLFNTEQTARDMDAIRLGIGDEKISYLGYSYGTLIGAVYAQLFPDRVRAFVLDGAVDPRQDGIAASEAQAVGFERAFDSFAADCKRRSCAIGPDARATVTQILAAVGTKPVAGTAGEKRQATSGYALLAIVAALYSHEQWPTLVGALDTLREGDPTGVFELADSYNERDASGHYSNQIDANIAVNCADEDRPPTIADIRRLQSTWRAKYPLFGAPLALSMLGCATWPAEHDPYPTGPAKNAPPIVVVGTTGDPATPYENAGKLASMLGTGVLLTWEGEGHTAYPQTGCIRQTVDDYLIELRPPPAGKRCPRI